MFEMRESIRKAICFSTEHKITGLNNNTIIGSKEYCIPLSNVVYTTFFVSEDGEERLEIFMINDKNLIFQGSGFKDIYEKIKGNI